MQNSATVLLMQVPVVPGELDEALMWAIGAALVALVIAIAVAFYAAGRASRRATEQLHARTRQLQDEIGALREEVHSSWRQAEGDITRQLQQQDEQIRLQLRQMSDEQAQRLRTFSQRIDQVTDQVGITRTQAVLLQAASRVTRARLHLVDQGPGIVQRDLAEADSALARAATLAPEKLKGPIDQVRRSLKEIAPGPNGNAYPAQALDSLADRIYDLVATHSAAEEKPSA